MADDREAEEHDAPDPPATSAEAAAAVPEPLAPAPPSARLAVIDVLRGAALAGILLANMRGFAAPAAVYIHHDQFWTARADVVVQTLIDVLVQGKFITIFAFLFGLGFAAQFERAEARHGRFVPVYRRRLLILLALGLIHGLGIWWGDILAPYAVAGFGLLLFRKSSLKATLWWAFGLYMLPMALFLSGAIAAAFGANVPGPRIPDAKTLADTIATYSSGTFLEIVRKRLVEVRTNYGFFPIFGVRVWGLFLFGVAVWRLRFFEQTARMAGAIRRWLLPLLVFGVAGSALPVIAVRVWHLEVNKPRFPAVGIGLVTSFATPALSAFYVGLVILCWERERWRRWLEPFAAVGRTALTNYLLQSVLATLLFYSYGFGLYGKWGPAVLLIPFAAIYSLQVVMSQAWLARYRFGPAEWVWRSLTYGQRQPMVEPLAGTRDRDGTSPSR